MQPPTGFGEDAIRTWQENRGESKHADPRCGPVAADAWPQKLSESLAIRLAALSADMLLSRSETCSAIHARQVVPVDPCQGERAAELVFVASLQPARDYGVRHQKAERICGGMA